MINTVFYNNNDDYVDGKLNESYYDNDGDEFDENEGNKVVGYVGDDVDDIYAVDKNDDDQDDSVSAS